MQNSSQPNPLVDKYLVDGCMRCKYGATPQCKVLLWTQELEHLRQIALESGLKEEIKWSVPVYTHKGKNILTVSALKACACLGFFKGVLLSDPHKLLEQQGTLQSDRLIRFTNIEKILELKTVLKEYIMEAIAIEESGQKVVFNKNPEPIPEELQMAFEEDAVFKCAFFALTPGRQKAYILHFNQAKQSATRLSRINKYKPQILLGIGLHDR
jgi:uncharacterized protein YdeI (YjbR/CyaY-like superfamily)